MTYQPVVPFPGNNGWSFLTRTRDAQQEAFNNSERVGRDAAYFRENIGNVTSAEDLVSDFRLLSFALGAFGLDEDIGNKFFIQKVLEEGTDDDQAFANKLSDKRYAEIAEAFGFDQETPGPQAAGFASTVIDSYQTRQFEVAVGNQDEDLRLALGLSRELGDLAQRELSEDAAWFTIIGTSTLRAVFEGALGLPPETGALDVDLQLRIFQDKSQSAFGTKNPLDFTDPDQQEDLVRRFLMFSEIANGAQVSSGGAIALSLLQAS